MYIIYIHVIYFFFSFLSFTVLLLFILFYLYYTRTMKYYYFFYFDLIWCSIVFIFHYDSFGTLHAMFQKTSFLGSLRNGGLVCLLNHGTTESSRQSRERPSRNGKKRIGKISVNLLHYLYTYLQLYTLNNGYIPNKSHDTIYWQHIR
jgi:hypothetical protein